MMKCASNNAASRNVGRQVPRTRAEFFQDDLFPPTRHNRAAVDAASWSPPALPLSIVLLV